VSTAQLHQTVTGRERDLRLAKALAILLGPAVTPPDSRRPRAEVGKDRGTPCSR
jgi:hypothetical protein